MNVNFNTPGVRSSKTIFNYLNQITLHGRSAETSTKVLEHVLNSVFVSTEGGAKNLFYSLRKLEKVLHSAKANETDILAAFCELRIEIKEAGRSDTEDEQSYPNKESVALLKKLVLIDASKVLEKYIACYTLFPQKIAAKYDHEGLRSKGVALEIFHWILIDYQYLASRYAENQNFLQCLFSYMQYHETCFLACRILECLFLSRKTILDLSTIENLEVVVEGLDMILFGNFCKILAVTLSELDMYEHKTSLYAQTKQKKGENFFVRDVNQDLILKIPNILSRLVTLACINPLTPLYSLAKFESQHWMQRIEEHFINDERNYQNTNMLISGLTQWSSTSSTVLNMTSVQIASELIFRADAVCVLGLLLIGTHRKEVQKELADLRLIPQLSEIFDHFVWKSSAIREHVRLPGHNYSCECSPEVALKIQVLRLIHSFCDHSDYKHVMLSWSEYSELQSLEESSKTSEAPIRLTKDIMCVGNKGLLSKIVDVMKKESGASTFRFWLSRAIESYLRGSYSSADQDFLLKRNLLQHIVVNLLSCTNRHKEVLQSCFDLLGELVKFNITAFRQLNSHLRNNAKRRFKNLMNVNLVDSNMFIRSLILSYELFISSDDVNLKEFAENNCYLLSLVSLLRTRVHYLKKLLSVITVQNLTQENVSCLNTALVILMYGLKKEELPQYLQVLALNTEACSVATNDHLGILYNLKDLLLFWQEHYLQKDKDCTILERSSRICVQEWRDAVSILTSEDTKNPCAISYYLKPRCVSSRAC